MGMLAIACVISFFAQLLLLTSAYRMDKYLKPLKLFPRRDLPSFQKNISIFYKKLERKDFLIYSVALQYLSYILAPAILILFFIALIIKNGDFSFIIAVTSFCIMGLDTLLLCFEMVMLTFFDKKTFGDE
ncbi:MAG: hypothetical protein EOM87_00380 [Clostridia bacterium]|nr:hypothetical protein [Clostridia bacterium]